MSTSPAADLERTFELASLRFEARTLTDDDWHRFREIQSRYQTERQEKDWAFRREYATRVEATRVELLKNASARRNDHKPRFGRHDRFDAVALERQAHRQVRDEHFRELARLEVRECEELRSLVCGEEDTRAATTLQRRQISFQGAPAENAGTLSKVHARSR